MRIASDRFWKKVQRTPTCWIWTGPVGNHGYGRFSYNGRKWGSHRIAWIFSIGLIPNELQVLHRCDNPKCCNPDHLWLGTHQDNMDDRKRKGRNKPPRGEAVSTHALTEKEVIEIRDLLRQKKQIGLIASLYRVSRTTIWCIAKRKTWNHI